MNILLLTKSFSFESTFIQKLNAMNHEVLCSEKLITLLIEDSIDDGLWNYFQAIIFSETLLNREIYEILIKRKLKPKIVCLKRFHNLDLEEQKIWVQKGITNFISEKSDFDDIREIFNSTDIEEKNNSNQSSNAYFPKKELSNLINIRLSRQEQNLFMELKGSNEPISRDELSRRLWKQPSNNSTQSRLSNLVKKINKKMKENEVDLYISTVWGIGYVLINV